MKVRDVLLQLKGLDRDVELLCFCNDEGSRRRDTPFLVYAVQRIDATLMSLGASGARPPAVVFGPGRNARQVAVLEITSDF